MDHSRPHGSADERRRDVAPTAVVLDACVTVRPVAQARPDEPSPTEEAMPRSERLSPEVIRAWAT